jgi:hypothetical protein
MFQAKPRFVQAGFCAAVLLILMPAAAGAGEKTYQGAIPYQPGDVGSGCQIGARTLCVPLDPTFTTVVFDGAGGNGPADPADPCQRNDDDVTLAIALPFTFNLYGTNYNSVFINNNGNVSFGASFSAYTSTGFPVNGFPMVAPFWADVDTRNANSGVVHYRVDANRLVVIWDNVGYFNMQADLHNTFELILSDGTDPLVGIGNNVCFCYEDMQWTTGSASGGVGGFGGVPATVGVNKGDGVNFAQIGRFDHEGVDYDGPGGAADGVSFLDHRVFCFNTGVTENIPPIPQGFPANNTLRVCVGGSAVLTTGFASPEFSQTTTSTVSLGTLPHATATTVPGNPSTETLTIIPTAADVGNYVVTYTACDDGNPVRCTTVALTVVIESCPTPAHLRTWGSLKSLYR